jgi:hypothetical protein
MAKDAVLAHVGRNARGGEQGRGNDESVDEQDHAALSRAEHCAGHHDDLEAAELGEHGARVRLRGQFGALDGLRQQVALTGQSCIVETRTAADAIDQRRTGQRVCDQRRGCRVADSHLTEAEYVTTGVV